MTKVGRLFPEFWIVVWSALFVTLDHSPPNFLKINYLISTFAARAGDRVCTQKCSPAPGQWTRSWATPWPTPSQSTTRRSQTITWIDYIWLTDFDWTFLECFEYHVSQLRFNNWEGTIWAKVCLSFGPFTKLTVMIKSASSAQNILQI